MMTTKRIVWLGALFFSLGVGCGSADSTQSASSSILAVTGSTVNGEQLALPDTNGGGAKDKAGPVAPSELSQLESLLNLTADQIAQIQPILDATRTALEAIRAQVKAGTLTPADAQTQVKALHDSQKSQILALLTSDQQAKFNQMRDHHCGPFDITHLADALGLSSDQVSQISALMATAQSKSNDIHTQVEAGTLSVVDAHAQLDQIHADTQTAIQNLLTAAQQAQLAQILTAHPDHGPGPGAPPPPPNYK